MRARKALGCLVAIIISNCSNDNYGVQRTTSGDRFQGNVAEFGVYRFGDGAQLRAQREQLCNKVGLLISKLHMDSDLAAVEREFYKLEKRECSLVEITMSMVATEADKNANDIMLESGKLPNKYQQPAFQCIGDYKMCRNDTGQTHDYVLCLTALVTCFAERVAPFAPKARAK